MNCLASIQNHEYDQKNTQNGLLPKEEHVLSKHGTFADDNTSLIPHFVSVRDKTATIFSQTRELPEFVGKVVENIERFSLFREGWDGDRAPRIKTDALMAALSLALESYQWSPDKPHIAPSVDGGIALSWLINEDNTEIEAEISGEGKVFIYSSDQTDEDKAILSDVQPKKAIEWLINECR